MRGIFQSMRNESINVEQLFKQNQLNKVKHKEFLDACNDRVFELVKKELESDKIIQSITEDIYAYKNQNKLDILKKRELWTNYNWYLITSIILNIIIILFYKHITEDTRLFKLIVLLNVIVIISILIFSSRNLLKLKHHLKYVLYGLMFYLPTIKYMIDPSQSLNHMLAIILNLGSTVFGVIIIRSIFNKKITMAEVTYIIVFILFTTTNYIKNNYYVWLILVIIAILVTLNFLVRYTYVAFRKKNNFRMIAFQALIMGTVGMVLYHFLKTILNYMYFNQIFIIIYGLLCLITYYLFINRLMINSIIISFISFILVQLGQFSFGQIRFGNDIRVINYYQSTLMFTILTILTFVILIKQNNIKKEEEVKI